MENSTPTFTLPSSVATKAQLLNLRKNLDDVLETMTQNRVRIHEQVQVEPSPSVSGALASLLATNKLHPTADVIRQLQQWVEALLHHAPVVRLTFSSDPGPKELNRMIEWFRQESGKVVLLHIGIQPTVAAGVIIRTTSHRYDLSLRAELLKRTDQFVDAINTVSAATEAANPQPPAQPQEAPAPAPAPSAPPAPPAPAPAEQPKENA